MGSKLTAQERQSLTQHHRQKRERRVCARIKVVLAYDDGYSYSEIARILLLDDEMIRRHIDYYKEYKLSIHNGGNAGKLTDREGCELMEHLCEVIYLYVKDICRHNKTKISQKIQY